MKTVGNTLKEARLRKKYSLVKLENLTKIKKEFINAIEEEKWETLPDYPVISGFVKSIAGCLDLNELTMVALLRRDYPSKKLLINPKPDIEKRFVWSPRLTFILGVGLILLVFLGYLGFEYYRFISPPKLIISEPTEGQMVNDKYLKVEGKTDSDATIMVNNQSFITNNDGHFVGTIEVFSGTKEIEIVAKSRSGKVSTVRRNIVPEIQ